MQGEVDGQAQLAREATALLNSVLVEGTQARVG